MARGFEATAVGIDVGGTKIAVAGLREGELSESTLMHTELEDQQRLLDQLAHAIEEARRRDTRGTCGSIPASGTPTTRRSVTSFSGLLGNSDAVCASGPSPSSSRSQRGSAPSRSRTSAS